MRQAAPVFVVLVAFVVLGCTAHTEPREPDESPPVGVIVEPPPLEPALETPREPDPEPELRWTEARCDLAPVSLTASDGSGLALTRFEAEVVVHGPLAFTELHLSFHNPEDRQIEGRFSVTLPGDAAISRLAMEIDGRWQEGEVVERQAARVAYEEFLHRRQDPALMEREAGNVYSARVFPIPARGDKHLIVSYSQEIAGSREPYRLPLCGLPSLAELDVEVSVQYPSRDPGAGGWSEQVFAVRERDFTPRGDLEVHDLGASAIYGVRSDELVIASVMPRLEAHTPEPLARATILFDTSASRANDFDGQVTRLGQLVRALGSVHPGLEVEVLAFDQDAELMFEGLAIELDDAVEARLRERGPLGASALDVALDTLARRDPEQTPERVILVSDGMFTAGEALDSLHDQLDQLERDGLRRLDVIIEGNSADELALTALARGELPEDGVILRGDPSLAEIIARLGAPTQSNIAVEVEGASWVWPEQLDGMQPGDATLVYAKLTDAAKDRPLRVSLGGHTSVVPTLPAPAPLVERAQARATVAALEAELLGELEPREAAAIEADIVAESVRHRVLSDLTALLVLESEDDYRRFGIQRDALADILTIGEQGVELRDRRGQGLVLSRASATNLSGKLAAKKKSRGEHRDLQPAGDDESRGRERRNRIQLSGGDGPLGGFGGGGGGGSSYGAVMGGSPGGVPGGVARAAESAGARELAFEDAEGPSVEGLLNPDTAPRARASAPAQLRPPVPAQPQLAREPQPKANPYSGRYATFKHTLARGRVDDALSEARSWVSETPGDVLAMVALGEGLEACDDPSAAARAYGSLIDLHPARVDIRRMAGARLEALGEPGLALAEDSYRRAVEQRPDHPSGYRLLAWVLVKRDDIEGAFSVLEDSLEREYPEGRFEGVRTVLRQDLGIVAAIWIAREPSREAEIRERVVARYTRVNNRHSLRFVLNWETDANDVDLHVWDGDGQHAFFGSKQMPSGGELLADVTTGYGPEAFVIYERRSEFPYRIMAHYYSRGAMGYGMGKLQVLHHDGQGHVAFSEHPFVVMRDHAWVDLSTVRRWPLGRSG